MFMFLDMFEFDMLPFIDMFLLPMFMLDMFEFDMFMLDMFEFDMFMLDMFEFDMFEFIAMFEFDMFEFDMLPFMALVLLAFSPPPHAERPATATNARSAKVLRIDRSPELL